MPTAGWYHLPQLFVHRFLKQRQDKLEEEAELRAKQRAERGEEEEEEESSGAQWVDFFSPFVFRRLCGDMCMCINLTCHLFPSA